MKFNLRLISLVGLFLILALPVISPLLAQDETEWPAPTGAYQVGVTSRLWVDEARDRELMIWFWYPADVDEDAIPYPYITDLKPVSAEIERLVAFSGGDLSATLEALPQIQLHSFLNAPISHEEATYPILIFTNGMVGIPTFYSQQFEELASHGYIVVTVVHTYFSDDIRPEVLVDDIVFVLEQLEVLNTDDTENMFTEQFDLEHMGIFGHSLGGGIAIQSAVRDNRIQVAISEDGDITVHARRLVQPVMFMAAGNNQIANFNFAAGPAYLFNAEGFAHGSFVDQLLWPARGENPIYGTIDSRRALEIVNAYVLAFFNQYLKGEDQDLLQGSSDNYPEVMIESRNLED